MFVKDQVSVLVYTLGSVSSFHMFYDLLVEGVIYLPRESSSIRTIRLACNAGVNVRLKKGFITVTVNYR